MKILQVITQSELGGAQTVVVQLANNLSKEYEVVLAAGQGDGKMWNMVSNQVIKEDCPHLQRSVSLKNDLLAAIELRRLYKKYKPDVIHLHSSKAGTLGRIVFPSKKTVYTVHGFDSVRLAFRKFLPIERFLQHFCKAVVGVSKYDEKNLLAEGIKNNVSTVYNGISIPDCSQISDIDVFNQDKKVVLTIARVSPPKKTDLFVEVARLLPKYNFVWIGNQCEVSEFGELPSNCHFLGNVPNAGAFCSKADLLMLPSNYEGLPMVILEAMSFGKPVVASDVGGISEIVRNEVNGYTLANDARLFAEKIQNIFEDTTLYSKFCQNSLDIFQRELTVEKMVQGYLDIYRR
ncbi:MAG: glycosyltransferase family 4 protein [Rikenellaceae bacterium]|nr:glycosyltransferase family 4 protein [Rikenellaceae bacterium]